MMKSRNNIDEEEMLLLSKIEVALNLLESAQKEQGLYDADDLLLIQKAINEINDWADNVVEKIPDPLKVSKDQFTEILAYIETKPNLNVLFTTVIGVLDDVDDIDNLFASEHEIGIIHPQFVPPPKEITVKNVEWVNLGEGKYKLGWRGDSRNPLKDDDIFKNGFKTREKGDVLVSEPFDSVQPNVIAFSFRPCAAACFPFNLDEADDTWIYAFKISTFF